MAARTSIYTTHIASLLLTWSDLADVHGCSGSVAARFIARGVGIRGNFGARVCFQDICDVGLRKTRKALFEPCDQVVLSDDIAWRD